MVDLVYYESGCVLYSVDVMCHVVDILCGMRHYL